MSQAARGPEPMSTGSVPSSRRSWKSGGRSSSWSVVVCVVQSVRKGFTCRHRPSTRKFLNYPESWDRSSLRGGECEEDKLLYLTNILGMTGMRFALRETTILERHGVGHSCVCVLGLLGMSLDKISVECELRHYYFMMMSCSILIGR